MAEAAKNKSRDHYHAHLLMYFACFVNKCRVNTITSFLFMDFNQQENRPLHARMPDSSNQDGDHSHEQLNRPSKSILKPNNDLTMDQNSLSVLLKASNLKQPRRVSFAPEVTLHKIDVIPDFNRRETISFMPHANGETPWGNPESDDSSEDDTSFLNLESDADKIVSGINRINNDVRSMNINDSPEPVLLHPPSQNKPSDNQPVLPPSASENHSSDNQPVLSQPENNLSDDGRVLPTPPYPKGAERQEKADDEIVLPPPPLLPGADPNSDEERVLPPPPYPPGTFLEQIEVFHDSLSVLPTSVVEEGEEEMEFTSQIPSLHPVEGEEEMELTSQIPSLHPVEGEEEMELTAQIQSAPPAHLSPSPPSEPQPNKIVLQKNKDQPEVSITSPARTPNPVTSLVHPLPTENDEEDMELTTQIPPPLRNETEEQEMEFTTPFKPRNIPVIRTSVEIAPQLSSSDDESDNDEGMEFTSNLGKSIQTNSLESNNEGTELASEFGRPIQTNHVETHDEITMDITNTFFKPPVHQTLNQNDVESTMDITKAFTTTSDHQTTEPAQLDVNSQPMQLTQPMTNLIVENGVEVNSQPMELSQENGAVLEEQSKRKLPEELEPTGKKSKFNDYEVSTTTTIPLAEVSVQSIDLNDENEDFDPVTLTAFLGDIGVRFYDDLEIGSYPANRVSLALSDKEFEMEDYYKANNKLPILEVFQLSCRELTTKINQDKQQYDSIKDSIFSENQDLFKSYYRSSFPEQLDLKSQFQMIKELSRQEAKKIWYEWRIKLMTNILNDLQVNFEILEQDKLIIVENISILDSVYDEVKHQYSILKQELTTTIESQEEFKKIDVSQIKDFKNKLMNINQELNDYQTKIGDKQQELNGINALIVEKDQEIALIKQKLTETEDLLKDRKHFSTLEIETLHLRFKVLQARSKLKYLESNDKSVLFEFDNLFKIEVEFDELKNSKRINYSIIEEKIPSSVANHEILARFVDEVSNYGSESILESFDTFKSYWKAFGQLSHDIYKLSIKFPLSIDLIDGGLEFTVRYYCRKNDFKALFTVSVGFKDLLQYPLKTKATGQILRSFKNLANDFIVDCFLSEVVSNDLLTKNSIEIV